MNRRSGHHDQEANVVIIDKAVTSVLDQHFDDNLEHSDPFSDDELVSPGPIQRAIRPILERLRPWM